MEAPDRILRRRTTRSRVCRSIGCVVCVVVILAIAIPVAIIFSRRKHLSGLPSILLLPLYIYPDPGAWEPLYEVLVAHPRLNFTVIINPENGPGLTQYPSLEYISQIQKLNAYSNVQTIGYVRTGFASRNITTVLQDVSTYSGWSSFNKTALAMHGIFFDEVPSKYSSTNAEYLQQINRAAKNALGLQSDRTVVHNPGTIPDTTLNDPSTDITVVFEGAYSDFQSQQKQLASLPGDRSQYSYILHSTPTSIDLRGLVDSLSQHAESLFFTSLTQNYYESFGAKWKDLSNAMAE